MLPRPTLQDLHSRALSDAQSSIDGATPTLRRGLIGPLMAVLANALHALYGWLIDYAAQCTPWGATREWAILGWANFYKLTRKPATASSGTVTFNGEIGRSILADTRLQSLYGVEYAVDEDLSFTGATVSGSVTAVDVGAAGNLPATAKLAFISPLTGVQAQATVDADGLGGGADLETLAALKARYLQRAANIPHGGAAHDYEAWALSIPSITRAWCFPIYRGPGSVRVYVINDNYAGPGLASAGDVSAVFGYIDPIKPAGIAIEDPEDPGEIINGLEVLAPVAAPVDLTITGVSDLGVQAAMEAALAELLVREARPEAGVPLTKIITWLGNAADGVPFELTAPTSSPTADAGEILTPGTITWL